MAESEYQTVVRDLARYRGFRRNTSSRVTCESVHFGASVSLNGIKKKVVGRLDSRFENFEADAAGEPTDFEASEVYGLH